MALAGDVETDFDTFRASVEWDGEGSVVTAIASDGDALIGMALLHGFRLTGHGIDGGAVTTTRLPA